MFQGASTLWIVESISDDKPVRLKSEGMGGIGRMGPAGGHWPLHRLVNNVSVRMIGRNKAFMMRIGRSFPGKNWLMSYRTAHIHGSHSSFICPNKEAIVIAIRYIRIENMWCVLYERMKSSGLARPYAAASHILK